MFFEQPLAWPTQMPLTTTPAADHNACVCGLIRYELEHITYVHKLVDSAMQRKAQSKIACNARSAKPFLDLALSPATISTLEWWDVLSNRTLDNQDA